MPYGLVDDTLPALTLRDELGDGVRTLGRPDDVRKAEHGVVLPLPAEVLVCPERQLDVLTGEAARISTDRLEHIASPDVEAARRAEHEPEARPRQAVVQERPEEVEVLERDQWMPVDAPLAVGRRHGATRVARDRELARDTDHATRILHREPHALEQGIALEDHVGVDTAEVAVARDVEAGVHRIRLASVRLVHDDEVRVRRASIDGVHLLAPKHRPYEDLVRLELEDVAQTLERAVRRAVVDDDHLVLGIVEGEDGLDGRDDRRRLVVRGDDDADRDREARRREGLVVLRTALVAANTRLERRDGREREVQDVDKDQVAERDQHDDLEERVQTHAARTWLGQSARAIRDSAASRRPGPPAA